MRNGKNCNIPYKFVHSIGFFYVNKCVDAIWRMWSAEKWKKNALEWLFLLFLRFVRISNNFQLGLLFSSNQNRWQNRIGIEAREWERGRDSETERQIQKKKTQHTMRERTTKMYVDRIANWWKGYNVRWNTFSVALRQRWPTHTEKQNNNNTAAVAASIHSFIHSPPAT